MMVMPKDEIAEYSNRAKLQSDGKRKSMASSHLKDLENDEVQHDILVNDSKNNSQSRISKISAVDSQKGNPVSARD